MYKLPNRITLAFVCEQRHHQAEWRGHHPEVEDQVVEEGEGRRRMPGVNFINVLQAAFAPVDPKSIKRYWQLDWILTLLGATSIKAVCKYVDEIEPRCQFHQHFTYRFIVRGAQNRKKTVKSSVFLRFQDHWLNFDLQLLDPKKIFDNFWTESFFDRQFLNRKLFWSTIFEQKAFLIDNFFIDNFLIDNCLLLRLWNEQFFIENFSLKKYLIEKFFIDKYLIENFLIDKYLIDNFWSIIF